MQPEIRDAMARQAEAYRRELLPAANLAIWSAAGNLEKTWLIIFSVEIDTVSDLAKESAAETLVGDSVA